MLYRMFDRHPYMEEVMALYNADTKMRGLSERLNSENEIPPMKLNLLAIEVYGCYNNLIEFVYLCRGEEVPKGRDLRQLIGDLLADESEVYVSDALSSMPKVLEWQLTPLPLKNIETTYSEVAEAFSKLCMFYNWVEAVYLAKAD